MADESTTVDDSLPDVPEVKRGSIVMAVAWSTIGMLFGAAGFAIPVIYPSLFNSGATEANASEAPQAYGKPAYIDFEETVVNIGTDRMNRYLRVKISLMVKESDKEDITELVTNEKAPLKSWLLSYLSDVTMEDIRGAAGQNRLRREIQNHFNSVLFDDGYDRIRDVLFLEFNVQ